MEGDGAVTVSVQVGATTPVQAAPPVPASAPTPAAAAPGFPTTAAPRTPGELPRTGVPLVASVTLAVTLLLLGIVLVTAARTRLEHFHA